ncbi:hypothetical protein [Thalassotalea mangrovi]|uniref:Outer membrane protein beta-barrel domain-containing protein n=1 Tax=Thalassotalea mangrovi TaxID=2572245 RepID=A0A4U1B9M3_9GAMM|nr:hypothetical protein [Thalassotalea mangrovi]TKB47411.1 hypothetical protein E8M12_01075 [Thalassotalea mangrovi]
MNKFALTLLISLNLSLVAESAAEDTFTFGLGAGSLYSGLGANVGIQTKKDIKYLAVGCVSYSSMYGATCGVGAGWVHTDIFNFQTPNHGLGIYVGIVGDQYDYFDRDAVYGAGVGYHYFFSGIDKSGVNLGFTATGADSKDGFDLGGMFQLGYQF